MSPVESLPPHLIVLRALVRGACGGALAAALGLTVIIAEEGPPPDGRSMVILVLAFLLCATWCGLLVLGEEVACWVPAPRARFAVPPALGLLLLLVLTGVGVWCVTLFEGGSMAEAMQKFLQVLGNLRDEGSEVVVLGAGLLLPFAGLGWVRLANRTGTPLGWKPQAGASVGGALLGLGLFCLHEGRIPHDVWFAVFTLGAMALGAALGVLAGERAEAALLRRWRARRED